MASFFQPGPATGTATESTTPSPAAQATQEFKIQLLGQLLNALGGNRPTFKSFVEGGPASTPFPQGAGAGTAQVLQAMMQPGAFTSTSSGQTTQQGATPSIFSDLTQLGVLGALLANSGALGGLGQLLGHPLDTLGGWLHIGGQPGPGAQAPDVTPHIQQDQSQFTTGDPVLDAQIIGQYGTNMNMIPGGSLADVPAGYPGLTDLLFGSSGG